ncbi:CRISPR-associated endonuclease Cas1 [Nitratifractor sp.]
MKLLLVDRKGESLRLENRSLRVGERRVPMSLVDILLVASSVEVETSELVKIARMCEGVILLDGRNRAAILHEARAVKSELKILQYRAYEKRRLQIASWILREKISRHLRQLGEEPDSGTEREYMNRIDEAAGVESLLGVEGAFGRYYFERYFARMPRRWHKGRRSKRPPEDPLNALLSFAYMLSYHYLAIRIIAYGFEPGVGFLHTPFRDHYALASDLMEFFRAGINDLVAGWIEEEVVELSDFSRHHGVRLRYEGRRKLWRSWREWIGNNDYAIDTLLCEIKERCDGTR